MENKATYFEHYEILNKKFDWGGNGNILLAKDKKTEEEIVIKILSERYKNKKDRNARFVNEIEALVDLRGESGIMPIYKWDKENSPFWYSMPITTPLSQYITTDFTPAKIIELYYSFGKALERVHSKKRTHRDIKPDNLFVLNGIPLLGDFGLVKNPHAKESFTQNFTKLGPTFYIAPEMLNEAEDFIGFEADVYSLAKSLWASITMLSFPIPGQHSLDFKPYLLENWCNDPKLKVVDYILNQATNVDPKKRMSLAHFNDQLFQYLNMNNKNFDFNINELASLIALNIKPNDDYKKKLHRITKDTDAIIECLNSEVKDSIDEFIKQFSDEQTNKPEWNINNGGALGSVSEPLGKGRTLFHRRDASLVIQAGVPINKCFFGGFSASGFEDEDALIYCGFLIRDLKIGRQEKDVFKQNYMFVNLYSAELPNVIQTIKNYFQKELKSALDEFIKTLNQP